MGIIVDLIIIAVVLLFIFLGYKKGLTGSLIKLLSFIIAIVVAFVLYKPVANAVIENTVIDDNIRTTLSATLGVEDKTENTEENVPSTIMDNINKEIENATDEVKANVIDHTTITIVNIGSGIVIFLAVRVILVLISLFAKILTDLPVIKQVDKLWSNRGNSYCICSSCRNITNKRNLGKQCSSYSNSKIKLRRNAVQ